MNADRSASIDDGEGVAVSSSAPGKVVLLGEYAVLEGAPAVTIAIDRRARVGITPLPGDRCEVIAPEVGCAAAPLRIDGDGLPDWRDAGEDAKALSLVDQVIRGLAREGIRLDANQAFRLRLDTSEFFSTLGGEHLKLGLGSSAALTVALAAALGRFAGHPPVQSDDTASLSRLLRLHRDFQGGRGSGVDVATSLVGGALIYRLNEGGVNANAAAVCWPSGLHALFVWSGRSASTPKFLARLQEWRTGHASDYETRMHALIQIAQDASVAVQNDGAATFIHAAAEYSSRLRALGIASGVDIVSAEHAHITAIAEKNAVVYKSCGAGGGDIGVALSLDPERLTHLRIQVAAAGFEAVPLALDPAGLQVS